MGPRVTRQASWLVLIKLIIEVSFYSCHVIKNIELLLLNKVSIYEITLTCVSVMARANPLQIVQWIIYVHI